MNPDEKITTYLQQSPRRWVMFLIATVAGVAVAAPLTLWTDTPLEGWKIFILVHGIIFWPWFVKQAVDKKQVSLLDVGKAAKEK